MSIEDPKYARDISYPLRFDENCDLALDENEEVIEQSLTLSVFTKKGSIILFREFGSDVAASVFDPLDAATELALDTSIREVVEKFEPRVILDRELVVDELPDSNNLLVLVPCTVRNSGQQFTAKIEIARPGMD